MNRNRATDRIFWHLTEAASAMLDPEECEAVHGDLAETGGSGWRPLGDVLGLVIRRQAVRFKVLRPWLVLASLVIPLGIMLSLVSRRTADWSAIYIWSYANNWDWTLLRNSGFWREMAECARSIFLSYVALACWSWTSGFLVASFSRRTIWFSSGVFFMAVFCAEFLGVPHSFGHFLVLQRGRDFLGNAAVFAVGFYRQAFPLAVSIILVILPAWWGMRQNSRMDRFPRMLKVVVLISTFATVATLVSQNLVLWQFRVWQMWPLRLPRLPSLMPLAIVGPMVYLLLVGICCRRNGPTAVES